jgi:hypothetical protein
MRVAALKAELRMLKDGLLTAAESLKDPQGGFLAPDLALSVRIMPHMLPKLGLLDTATIQSVIDAYLVLDQYRVRLLLLGGRLAPNFGCLNFALVVPWSAEGAPLQMHRLFVAPRMIAALSG